MSYQLLIDGKLVDGASTLEVVDPALGAAFATCARANEGQLNEAVGAAKRAFPSWSDLSHDERRDYLNRMADAVEARAGELANLLTREQGKPLQDATLEVYGSAAVLRYFGDQELPLRTIRETEEGKILEQHVPLGVVATIAPWNFPLFLMVVKIAPALITGNTVIAKPAPTTPLTTVLFGAIAVDILPAGVLNVIVDNNDLGPKLTAHPDVAKVSFTGSTATGRQVMASAAPTLKRLTLELGGNDPALVMDDADVESVAPKLFWAAMNNAGQVCLAAKRIYAPRSLYDALCDELERLGREVVVGNGLKGDTQIGPIQNKQQYDRVVELIEDARRVGTVRSNSIMEGPGYFIAPTIVRDIPDNSRIVREEQFGPVVPVLVYDDIDEVICRVNDSEFGLGATIWTNDIDRALGLAKRIESGTVWINKHLDIPFDVPFGGAKQSGLGRAQGIEGLKEYTQTKIINISGNGTSLAEMQ